MATATIAQPQTASLTPNDVAVLSALFDPESSPSSSNPVSKTAPNLPHVSDSILPSLQSEEIRAIQPLNNESPSHPAIQKALYNLTHLINQHPKYAPAYLNRAQAARLLIVEEVDLFTHANSEIISRALSDLNQAISLASPPSATAPISDLQACLLSKAHTHRGYLLLQASKRAANETGPPLPAELGGAGSELLEEMASKDFFLGGRYGNNIARHLSVNTNPYAKMCGAIVREAMRKELLGQVSQ